MPYPVNTFPDFTSLMNYINTFWITNGVEEITGIIGNDVVNGLLTFIQKSPLNWQKAKLESSGGAINAARPVNVFMSLVPDSLTWGDNIYYEYVFINTTQGDIPTLITYYDINLQPVNIIPAKSIVNISKASNDLWIVSSVPSSGSSSSVPPYIGVVDRGMPSDPVSGTSVLQSNSLIGLGSTNNGDITILYAEGIRNSFGADASISYDSPSGTITLNAGEQFFTGAALWVDRNQ